MGLVPPPLLWNPVFLRQPRHINVHWPSLATLYFIPPYSPPLDPGTGVFSSEKWVCFVVLMRQTWDWLLKAIVKEYTWYCSSAYWGGKFLWPGRAAKENFAQTRLLLIFESGTGNRRSPFILFSIAELLKLSPQTVVYYDHTLWTRDACETVC